MAEKSEIGRRTLLQAAFAAPATAALLGAPSAGAAPAAGDGDQRFTIAVLPDTQYLLDEGGSDPEPVREALRALVRRRREANIVFLAHLGDVTEHGTEKEMRTADSVFGAIGGQLPYSVLAGNHDVPGGTDDQRGPTPYSRTFGPDRFARMKTFGGASPGGYNTFHVISGGGREWLLLALDWRVSDKGVEWAQGVLDRHRNLPTILTTHDLVAGSPRAELSGHGTHLWEKLIRRNDQIFLTLNGHYWPSGRTTLTNDHGNPVHLHITNYQERYYGGAGMVRFYSFDLARNVIDVETFSPWLLTRRDTLPEAETAQLSGETDRFTVEIDFRRRFAAFAPPALPAPRPARAVLTRDTVAYWRFDTEGLPSAAEGAVAPGTVVRDLTGNGNDLTVQHLHASAPDVLTWSRDHHDAQPAHASLSFAGGKGPDRGAILRTSPTAAINSAKFESGYTIETFLKLPSPFAGDHAFMGVLSWEGRAGDAGKHSGWSDDEPTCSLNVSGERFLQFVVYPVPGDADPTSWSHAIPVGRWTHVAVVNDGRRTTMYVDGAKIARNAAEESRGITTQGKPFVIGATQFALRYGQGFYGAIGDTRVVGRALRPNQFLTG
ncbi:Concanavalin A-like lectin/glucanases superfamily protein [Lentzea xinjiangensis]|uniref:Concanavalin A-like lectin/glucanases superfamily protein n=1 Tax=Lentzea xinjiangensis TaxID=402600 RepID=A0A1H9RS22_9PSEU|nr:LamG-like jellyroll fold domain-containing protein [Lentzea xinjiangensis]SER75612.1 Concanavalin A-like lectin/glucanases superfamily protein [Lentzea xinjiangensis]